MFPYNKARAILLAKPPPGVLIRLWLRSPQQATVMETEVETQIMKWPAPFELRHTSNGVHTTFLQHNKYIEVRWNGHITSEDVVSTAKVYLELLLHHPCPKLLNNKSEATGDWQDANEWIQFEWVPQVTKAGLHYMAHIYSDNMFSRLSALDLLERTTPHLYLANFNEREQAISWLLQQ